MEARDVTDRANSPGSEPLLPSDSEEEGASLRPRILYDNSAESEPDNSEPDHTSEPEEVKRAWEELVIIQREQQR